MSLNVRIWKSSVPLLGGRMVTQKNAGYGGQLCASLGFQLEECRPRVEAFWLGNRAVRLQNFHHALRKVLALLLSDLFSRIFPVLLLT